MLKSPSQLTQVLSRPRIRISLVMSCHSLPVVLLILASVWFPRWRPSQSGSRIPVRVSCQSLMSVWSTRDGAHLCQDNLPAVLLPVLCRLWLCPLSRPSRLKAIFISLSASHALLPSQLVTSARDDSSSVPLVRVATATSARHVSSSHLCHHLPVGHVHSPCVRV